MNHSPTSPLEAGVNLRYISADPGHAPLERTLVYTHLKAGPGPERSKAVDRIGLLFQVFHTIGQLGLAITHARINTEKGTAIDSFCLTGPDGQKITTPALLGS